MGALTRSLTMTLGYEAAANVNLKKCYEDQTGLGFLVLVATEWAGIHTKHNTTVWLVVIGTH